MGLQPAGEELRRTRTGCGVLLWLATGMGTERVKKKGGGGRWGSEEEEAAEEKGEAPPGRRRRKEGSRRGFKPADRGARRGLLLGLPLLCTWQGAGWRRGAGLRRLVKMLLGLCSCGSWWRRWCRGVGGHLGLGLMGWSRWRRWELPGPF